RRRRLLRRGRSPVGRREASHPPAPDRHRRRPLPGRPRPRQRTEDLPRDGQAARLDGHPRPAGRQRAGRLPLLRRLRREAGSRPGEVPGETPARAEDPSMIDKIITFSIKNRGVVIASALALAIAGAFAAWGTPVDAIPDLSENQVIVFADWMGHSP